MGDRFEGVLKCFERVSKTFFRRFGRFKTFLTRLKVFEGGTLSVLADAD